MIVVCRQHRPHVEIVQRVQRIAVAHDGRRISVKQVSQRYTVAQKGRVAMRVQIGGLQGPPGLPGGETVAVTKKALGAISGHRIVRSVSATQVGYADATDITNSDDVLGLTLNAGADGADVQVLTDGEHAFAGWAWTPLEPIYLTGSGMLTQTEPSAPGSAFSLPVGFATSSTSMRVRIGIPIEL